MQLRRVLKYSAFAALGAVSASLLAAVATNTAPVITSKPYPVAELGQPYKYAVQAKDAEGNSLSYSVEQGPGGMGYSAEDKAATWTPTATQLGVQQVRVRARDSWGASSDQQFALHTVADFCEIYPIALPQSVLATARSGDVLAKIPRGAGAGNFSWLTWTGSVDEPTLAASLLPPGDSYNYTNPGDAADHLLEMADWAQGATGSMNANAVRERLDALKSRDIVLPTWSTVRSVGSRFDYQVARFATVRLKAYDLTGNGWLSFEFRGFRNCYNDAPLAPDQSVATREDTPVSFQLDAIDPEQDALTIRIVDAPLHGELQGTGTNLTYVPSANFNGTDSFSYVASDGELQSGLATVRIEVAPVNDLPQVSDQQLQTSEDVPLPVRLSAQDPDAQPISYRIVDAPDHGTLSGSNGVLAYLPDPDFHGADAFTWIANDGIADSAPAVVTIAVIERNDAPTAQNLQLLVEAGKPIDIHLLASDPDGDALSYRLLGLPGHGELTGSGANLAFAADAGFNGTVSFVYVANDGRLDSAPATVAIQVYGDNHPPRITTTPASFVDERSAFAYDVDANDPDAGDVLGFRLDRSVAGAAIARGDGLFGWSAEASFVEGVRELDKSCKRPLPEGRFDPKLKWHWSNSENFPNYNQVMTIPLVAQMTDDNGDGKIDANDDTDIVFTTHRQRDLNAIDAVIRIVDGATGAEKRTISPKIGVDGLDSLALADIDRDGRIDIVALDIRNGIQALRADGRLIWRYDSGESRGPWGKTPTIADLDGDGRPEIIADRDVVDDTGHLKFRLGANSGRPNPYDAGMVSVADLDGDGKQEIVAGGMAYKSNGDVLWKNEAVGDGGTAIGNLVGDSNPEVVVVHGGEVFLLSSMGSLLWRGALIPGGTEGGSPTLADMDGDGELEIGTAGVYHYAVFNADGSLLWSFGPTQDRSTVTGSTVFDFDGDGQAEVLYSDENSTYVLRGRDGKVIFETANSSGTVVEFPVVANVDKDPGAEYLVGANQRYRENGELGLRVFESATDAWMPTRAMWNQHAYSIDNINDDGSVPAHPRASWLGHNTFRLNRPLDRDPAGMADLALFDLRLDPLSPSTLRMTARNRGLAPSSVATVVHVYNGASASGKLIGTFKLASLAAGEDRDLRLEHVDAIGLGDAVYAVIDEVNSVAECHEENNGARARVFHVRASDQGGLYDTQVFTVGVRDVNEAPVFQASTPPEPRLGQKFSFAAKAIDPDLGDGLRYTLENAPFGMSVDSASGVVRWIPLASQAGARSFVVRATDLRGASVTKTISLTLPANRAPVIDSEPVTEAVDGQEYAYDLHATDPDGDVLSYVLESAPAGMRIADGNGAIRWPEDRIQAGTHAIVIRVQDANGGVVRQSYALTVLLPENHAPAFDSAPVLAVALGQRYQYAASAKDPDGDGLRYQLLDAPLGMAVDTVTGTIVWQPRSEQVGAHVVRLQVNDPRGATDEQEFTVLVSAGVDGGNHPPTISSVPSTAALIGAGYAYPVVASDLDGDALSYSLQGAPEGMDIDAQGRVQWTPRAEQAGLNSVTVVVDDGHGARAMQLFTIVASTVAGNTGNLPPAISSDPLTLVTLGQTYRYYIAAADPDGDALSYSLEQGPPGMSIDPATGVVAWTPPALGTANVTVRVSDGRGGAALQSFVVSTVATQADIDHRAVVTEAPSLDAKVGVPYVMPLQAVDADGDTMRFELLDGPAGATVDAATGVVSWTPSQEGAGSFTVRIRSGSGYTDVSWTVSVVSAEMPLGVHVVVNPEQVAPGGAYVVGVEVAGAAGPITIAAELDGAALALDADGQTSLVAPTTPGHYLLSVTVGDGHESTGKTADLFVSDPSDLTAPGVNISSPGVDARITKPTPVFGEVVGDDVARWTLSLLDKATGATTPIAQGDRAVGVGVLGTLDPTLSTNGFYALVLQAWDANGNKAQTSRTVLIDGEMKLGHFSLSFEDVSIPMAGMPIRVTRTYDTRRRNERLDFGFGWSVDYQNIRLTESRAPGFSWTMVNERNGFFGNWCVRPNGDPIVAVTAPDGKLLKFRAKASPECQFAAPQPDVEILFEPLPGTDAQLSQTDYGIVRLTQVAGSGVYNLLDMGDTSQLPANPSHYRLKLPDGTVYSITQGVGLTQVSEPDGNTLTYSATGIRHSRGQEITFLRDGLGRIEQVVLPDGRRRSYKYTPDGDLEVAVDTGADSTSFTYLPQAPHYLRDIIDPRKVRVSRNEYDDEGRLVATLDAEGHRIEYTHDLDGRVETIKDRRGYTSTYVYDDEGRVTAESNALGETTLHKYDANGNELETTDPLHHVTTRTFDARGNLLTETNPEHEKVTRTYDDRNNLLTQVDALGRTVASNAYHAYNGKLVMTQDALGNVTTFGYDSGLGTGGSGELSGIVDAADNVTRYEMDFWGHRAREFDAAGNQADIDVDSTGRVWGERKRRTRPDGVVEVLETKFELDDKDRVRATVHPDGSRTTVEYDGNGKPTRSCDALQRCTVQTYNVRGELERTTYPDNTYEESFYDENGNVWSRRDRGGRVTKMVYDRANRLLETILPDETPGTDADNPHTFSEYDAAGRMVASVDELGHRTTYGYDDAGRRIWVKDALNHVTTTDYDAAGQRIAVTDALGHTTRFEYDLAGRLVTTIHPDNTPASLTDNPRTHTEYDAVGRKLAEIDELGRRKEYGYDPLGRLVSVTLPNPKTGLIDEGALITRYGYDEAGNKVSQTDALGRVTRWEYDPMGRQLQRTLPLGQSESMAYDAAGQLKSRTDFKGVTTRYSYDAAGRLAGTDYAHDADVITTYTDSGQRESVTDGQGTTLYTYDARDRLARVLYPDGNAIAYDYDAAGNRTALHSPAQDQRFEFDELNRLWKVHTRVLGGAERTVVYGYDDVGNRTHLVQADGTSTVTVFDQRNRLRQLTTRNAAGVVLFGATYEVDPTGARVGSGEFDASGPTRSVGWGYDGVKRLTAEVITRAGQPSRVTEYEYDAVGNRLKKTEAGVATHYLVDENDRLQTETISGVTTIYYYDANGSTTGQAKPGESTTYTYDDANRLVRTQNSAGLDVATGYGAEGVRNREFARHGIETTWLIDPNRDYAQSLEAYSGGQLSTSWAYGNELLSQSNIVQSSAVERNLEVDGMGSVRLASDRGGQVTDSFEYDAFGVQLARVGGSDIDHRYRSEQIDPNTSFYNLRARWYDARSGRFISRDSWDGASDDPRTLHKYVYGNGDPVLSRDPSGNSATTMDTTMSISLEGIVSSLAKASLAAAAVILPANRALRNVQSRAAAQACAATFATGLRAFNSGDCAGVKMPIVYMNETLMPGIGEHVLLSQAMGNPAILHRAAGLQISNRAFAIAKCAAGMGLPVAASGFSCDEYPFASSFEGGYNPMLGTVARVDLLSNLIQGGVLSSFYQSCMIQPNVYPLNEFLVLPVISTPTPRNFDCRFF